MLSTIKKFYIFNVSGRVLGIVLDLTLVYLAAELFAKSFYLFSSIPVLIYSLLAYTSTVSNVSPWATSLMSKLNVTIILVAFYCFASFYTATRSSLISDVNYIVVITIVAFFAGIVTNIKSASNDNTVWLFPAAGFLSLCIGLVGALTLKNGGFEAFYVVILMTLITPLVFVYNGNKKLINFSFSEIKILAVIAILFCGLRHFVLIMYRFYVPEDSVIEYSFNSRIIQNIYAFTLIPLIVYLGKSSAFKATSNGIIFIMLASILISALLLLCLPVIEIFKIHITWLLLMIILGVAIFCSDFYLVTKGHTNLIRVISTQISISLIIIALNFGYWGLNY